MGSLTYVGVIQHLHDPHFPEELLKTTDDCVITPETCKLLSGDWCVHCALSSDNFPPTSPLGRRESIFDVGLGVHFLLANLTFKSRVLGGTE